MVNKDKARNIDFKRGKGAETAKVNIEGPHRNVDWYNKLINK